MTKIHYILPMAGRGSRFKKEGFDFPKPLIQIAGKPFFYWATQSVKKFVPLASLRYVVLQEHVDKYGIDKEILSFFPEAKIHILPEVTEGAVITCLKGVEGINDQYPVVFNDCDHMFKSEGFNNHCKGNPLEHDGAEGILLTFHADEPKYSFVMKDTAGNVVGTVEKEVVSNEAICGCYYFANVDLFKSSAVEYLTKCSYNEFFMSGVYNVLIENQKRVCSIETDYHVPFGVPEEYETAKHSKYFGEMK